MAYRQAIRNKARRLWFEGYSERGLIEALKAAFPGEKTPTALDTIQRWKNEEDWATEKEEILTLAKLNQVKSDVDDFAKLMTQMSGLWNQLAVHAQLLMGRAVRNPEGQIIDTNLTSKDVINIANSLDKATKNQRLINDKPTEKIESDANVNATTTTTATVQMDIARMDSEIAAELENITSSRNTDKDSG